MEQQQRLLVRSGPKPREDGLPLRVRSDELRVDPLLPEELLEEFRARRLAAGRIGRVDLQIRDERFTRLAVERIVRPSCRAPAVERRNEKRDEQKEKEPTLSHQCAKCTSE